MLLTEQNGANQWQQMLKENFNVTDNEKLAWVSQYAAIHEIHEAQIGVNANEFVPANGVNPIYATPLNTTGMGDVAAPGAPSVGSNSPAFFNQKVGSGDIPVSTLPMGLNIALMTIGLELLPVIPAKGPWVMLSYMDFPYAGGKLDKAANLTKFDGFGEGKENKPIYVKFLGNGIADVNAAAKAAVKAAAAGEKVEVTVDGGEGAAVFTGYFKCAGRMDGGLILETVKCEGVDATTSENVPAPITDVFKNGTVTITVGEGDAKEVTNASADFAETMVDFVDGFANFVDGEKRAMTRAENETGTGNVIGLRLYSKWVEMGAYEVTGTVTRQQLQDLPLYGVDAVAKVMEALQNEISQHINARILEHVFALGVTNAVNLKASQGIDLNLWMGKADTTLAQMVDKFVDVNDVNYAATWGTVKNTEVNTSAENLHTRQRRVASRILAAANIIQVTGRRGRPSWIITNTQVATALQDNSSYIINPMVNGMAQDGSQNLYLGGTIAGLKVYVDPYMDWNDCRICVGRKGNGNEPGAIFMPYILADTVSITAEGTMAPKMLVNSRYAIVDAGFYPWTQYFTFAVGSEFNLY